MGTVYVDYVGNCKEPLASCDEVYLCLPSIWAERTESGFPFATGKIVTVTGLALQPRCGCVTKKLCVTECTYQVQVDDAQFLTNPETEQPYVLTSESVLEIFPYSCTLGKILELIAGS